MNIKEIVRDYAWIEFAPKGEAQNTVEYTIWINWLNGSLYAKQVTLIDSEYSLNVLDLEMNQAINDFITYLEKLK